MLCLFIKSGLHITFSFGRHFLVPEEKYEVLKRIFVPKGNERAGRGENYVTRKCDIFWDVMPMQFSRSLPSFWSNILPPSSGPNSMLSKQQR
jgi:hypothetical protein